MKKRLLCALLACMLLSGAMAAVAEEVPVPDFGKYDETVVITAINNLSDQVRQNTLKDEYTIEDNPWQSAYLEYLNVKREYLWITASDEEYNTKRSLALAAGEIPDSLQVSQVELMQLAEAGVIVDNAKELFDEYAGDQLKSLIGYYGDIAWEYGAYDGDFYGIPCAGGQNYDCLDFVWIRSDWLENLGMQPPTNYSELLAVIEAFVTQDPDGNGEDDTFGLALCNDLDSEILTVESFLNLFGAYYDMWIEKDGQLVYSATTQEAKNALAALRDMYAKGWLDPEFGVKDQAAVAMDIANNEVGVVFAVNWAPLSTTLNNCIQANPEAGFICVPAWRLANEEGTIARSKYDPSCNSFIAISSACEHPEAVIKMMSLYTELYANHYSEYGITDDGREMWHLAGFPTLEDPLKNCKNMMYGGQYLRGEAAAEDISGEQLQMALNVQAFEEGDRTMWPYYAIFADDGEYNSSEWFVREVKDDYDTYYICEGYRGPDTQGMIDYEGMLATIRDEAYIKIIIGDEELDYFDTFVEEWYAAGGQTITDEVNDWFAEQ